MRLIPVDVERLDEACEFFVDVCSGSLPFRFFEVCERRRVNQPMSPLPRTRLPPRLSGRTLSCELQFPELSPCGCAAKKGFRVGAAVEFECGRSVLLGAGPLALLQVDGGAVQRVRRDGRIELYGGVEVGEGERIVAAYKRRISLSLRARTQPESAGTPLGTLGQAHTFCLYCSALLPPALMPPLLRYGSAKGTRSRRNGTRR